MKVPLTYPCAWPLTVVSCTINRMGGTDFVLSFCGQTISGITLDDDQVGDGPGQRGYDDVRNKVEACAVDIIARALEVGT